MDILDRIEEETAYIEGDHGIYTVPANLLDAAVQEGDVLVLLENGTYVPDVQATLERRERLRKLRQRQFRIFQPQRRRLL